MKIIDLYLVAEFYSTFKEGHFLRTAEILNLDFFFNNVFSRVKH